MQVIIRGNQNESKSKLVQLKTSVTQNECNSKTSANQNECNSKRLQLKTNGTQNECNSKRVQL